MEFELPIGNRAPKARMDQRQWELPRAMHQYRAVVDEGMTEVDLALREVDSIYQEMVSRWEAMQAASAETEYLRERWTWLGGSDRTSAGLLEDLLLAQERLADEEEAFVTAQVRYVLSLTRVRRATGTLLQSLPVVMTSPGPGRSSVGAASPEPIVSDGDSPLVSPTSK